MKKIKFVSLIMIGTLFINYVPIPSIAQAIQDEKKIVSDKDVIEATEKELEDIDLENNIEKNEEKIVKPDQEEQEGVDLENSIEKNEETQGSMELDNGEEDIDKTNEEKQNNIKMISNKSIPPIPEYNTVLSNGEKMPNRQENPGDKRIVTGSWGTSNWELDRATGVMKIGAGQLATYGEAPWNRAATHYIGLETKKIIIADNVKHATINGKMFSGLPKNQFGYNVTGDGSFVLKEGFYRGDLINLVEIEGLNKLDFSSVRDNIGFMFMDASALKHVELNGAKMSKGMSYPGLFKGCKSLETVDISSLNSSYESSEGMFEGTPKLGKLVLGEDFTFGNVVSFPVLLGEPNPSKTGLWIREDGSMKEGVTPAKLIEDYNNYNPPGSAGNPRLSAGIYVGDGYEKKFWGTASWDFNEVEGVLTINGGKLDSSETSPWNRKDSHKIDREKIKKINISGDIVAPENSSNLFANLVNLEIFEALDKINVSEVINMENLFMGCEKLKELTGIDKWNTSKVTNMNNVFKGNSKIDSLDISSWSTAKVTDMNNMFQNVSLKDISLGGSFRFSGNPSFSKPKESFNDKWTRFDRKSAAYTPEAFVKTYGGGDLVAGKYVGDGYEKPLYWGTSEWKFNETTGLLTIQDGSLGISSESPWERTDTYQISSSKIKKIVLGENIEAPANSSKLFSGSTASTGLGNVTEIDGLSNLNTENVTDMSKMFYSMNKIKTLDLKNFDTRKVTTMDNMFADLKLSKLELGDHFKFKGNAALGAPIPSVSGKWMREDGYSSVYSPTDFMTNYGSTGLDSGTYVGDSVEVEIQEVEWEIPTIGENATLKFKIKEINNRSIASENLTVDLTKIVSKDSFSMLSSSDCIKISAHNKEGKITETQSLSNNSVEEKIKVILPEEGYIGVTIDGLAVNNTTKGTKNNKITVKYPTLGGVASIVDERYLEINNGRLDFSTMPKELTFKKTTLPWGIEKLFIGRENDNWNMDISDLRGTNPMNAPSNEVARQNWELVATADAFKDSKNKTVAQDVLSVTYKSPTGETQFLTVENETTILKKDVTGEKPIENRITSIQGDKDKGFRAYLSSSSKVDRDKTYNAKINFELRQAP